MVEIGRRGQAEQLLQKALQPGGRIKIAPPHDMADALECVVDHERKLPGMTLLHCKAR